MIVRRGFTWWAERAYAVFALLLILGALSPIFSSEAQPVQSAIESGTLSFQLTAGAVYFVALLYVLRHDRDTIAFLRGNLALFSLLGFTLLSAAWSEIPMVTLRRLAALIMTTVFALYLAHRFPSREFLRLLAIALAIAMLATIIFALAAPDIGIDAERGDWRGVFDHKNRLGRIAAFSAATFTVLAFAERNWRGLALGLAAISVGLSMLSGSRTGWITGLTMAAAALGALFLHARPRTRGVRLFVCIALALAVSLAIFTTYQVLLQELGRDATLTGRTTIWTAALPYGLERPLLGWGYRSFWHADGGQRVADAIGWDVLYGHNGFLDLWLELGLVGVVLFALTLAVALRRAYRRLVYYSDFLGVWYVLLLVFTLIVSMSVPLFLQQSDIVWLLFLYLLLRLTPRTARAKRPS